MNLSSDLRSIRSRINALERKMACALAQVKLERQSNELCEEWSCAQIEQQPLPDPHAFIQKVVKAGFQLPTFTAVFRYLNRCLAEKEVPDPQRLLKNLLPFPPVIPAF